MRRSNFFAKFFLLITNLLAVFSAFSLSYFLRFETFSLEGLSSQNYNVLLIFSLLICIIVSLRDRIFTEFEVIRIYRVFISVLRDVASIVLGVFVLIVALKGYQYSRQFHILFASNLIFSFFISRLALFGIFQSYQLRRQRAKKIVIVATKSSKALLVPIIQNNTTRSELSSKVYLIDSNEVEEENGLIFLPTTHIKRAFEKNVEELILFFSDSHRAVFESLIEQAESFGIRVRVVPNFSLVGSLDLVLEKDYGLPLLRIRPEPLEDVNNYLLKRVFDIFFSLIFLIFVFPLIYLIIAPLIKLSSKGPVFFKQKRTGQLNNEFYCKKFRTMAINKNADNMQATKNDARITWIGKIMRKTNIDEFPQFWNVLVGDMSVCGPRPHMLAHTEEYSKIITKYRVRHFCKPGITGWAQINGFRGETTDPELMRKRVAHDIWYIENWTFWLDIKIIILTIFNMIVGQKEAY